MGQVALRQASKWTLGPDLVAVAPARAHPRALEVLFTSSQAYRQVRCAPRPWGCSFATPPLLGGAHFSELDGPWLEPKESKLLCKTLSAIESLEGIYFDRFLKSLEGRRSETLRLEIQEPGGS